MPTLSSLNVSTSEIEQVETAAESLPAGDLKTTLALIASDIRHGRTVIIEDEEHAVTTTEAARMLGISRPHLYKILDAGALDFVVVGTSQRRVRIGALVKYRDRLRESRAADALLLAHQSRNNGDSLIDAII